MFTIFVFFFLFSSSPLLWNPPPTTNQFKISFYHFFTGSEIRDCSHPGRNVIYIFIVALEIRDEGRATVREKALRDPSFPPSPPPHRPSSIHFSSFCRPGESNFYCNLDRSGKSPETFHVEWYLAGSRKFGPVFASQSQRHTFFLVMNVRKLSLGHVGFTDAVA